MIFSFLIPYNETKIRLRLRLWFVPRAPKILKTSLSRGPHSSSTEPSSRTFLYACVHLPRGPSSTSAPASRSSLIICGALLKDLSRRLRPPPSRSLPVVYDAFFKDLPRRLRLPLSRSLLVDCGASSSCSVFKGTQDM